jgi:NTP pyrophosphatase (non-canonical NTP hydrolase)
MVKEQILEFKKVDQLSDEDRYDFIEFLAKYNKPKFNINKCAEELAELLEVLLKYQTKSKEHRPDITKISEEMGDVMLRLAILMEQLGITEIAGERADQKMDKLYEYYKEGKYEKGI